MSMHKRTVLQSALAISHKRPKANLEIEQYLMTAESMAEQVIALRDTLAKKRVLHLGDDDHLSVLFAKYLNTQPVIAEYDARIRKSLTQWHNQNSTPATIFEYDARDPLPGDIYADTFYINPPYSSKNAGKGAMVWISRVAGAVPVGSTSILVYPIDEDLSWTLTCLRAIVEYAYQCGLAVTKIERDLHTYGYLPKDPGLLSSNIYLYKYAEITPTEIKDIEGDALYR